MSQPSTTLHLGDCLDVLRTLPDASVQTCVTSPPYYGLRDYGVAGQIGLEPTPREYVARLVDVFREVRRVLRDDGTAWVNLGDSFSSGGRTSQCDPSDNTGKPKSFQGGGIRPPSFPGLKPKDLLGIPWRVAFALQDDGWYLRSDIIWAKPNPMPESVRDRPTKSHEYVFLLSKRERYYYDQDAVREEMAPASAARYAYGFGGEKNIALVEMNREGVGRRTSVVGNREATSGRNLRSVWTITPRPFKGAHFAVMPPELVERCVKAGSKEGDTVLDPFVGSGTVAAVANALGRDAIGIDLNLDYLDMANDRVEVEHEKVSLFRAAGIA